MRSLTMPATQCDAKVIDELKTRLIRGVSCEVDLEEVSSIMPEDKDADTPFAVAQDYAAKLGFELACVSKEMQKGRAPFEPSCEEEEEDEFEPRALPRSDDGVLVVRPIPWLEVADLRRIVNCSTEDQRTC